MQLRHELVSSLILLSAACLVVWRGVFRASKQKRMPTNKSPCQIKVYSVYSTCHVCRLFFTSADPNSWWTTRWRCRRKLRVWEAYTSIAMHIGIFGFPSSVPISVVSKPDLNSEIRSWIFQLGILHPAVRISSNRINAICLWPPFSQAPIAASKLITFGLTFASGIAAKTLNAFCHWPPFWQALMVALKPMTSGCTCSAGISSKKCSACSHWLPFSQALMVALQPMTFGRTLAMSIRLKRTNAGCHSPPFSQALMLALKQTQFASTSTINISSKRIKACCHWPWQALMAAPKVTTFAGNLAEDIAAKRLRACCHCAPFSQALMIAL